VANELMPRSTPILSLFFSVFMGVNSYLKEINHRAARLEIVTFLTVAVGKISSAFTQPKIGILRRSPLILIFPSK
jgi:hypothetical protein